MEKSVLLETIKNCKQAFVDACKKAYIFDLSDNTVELMEKIGAKFDNNIKYVEQTNLKEETINKLFATYETISDVNNNISEYVTNITKNAAPSILAVNDPYLIEIITTKNTKAYSAEEKKLITTSKKEKHLTKKALDTIKSYHDKKGVGLTEEEVNILNKLINMITISLLEDAKLNNEDRFKPLPFNKERKEQETIVEYLKQIEQLLTSKKKRKASTKAGEEPAEKPAKGEEKPAEKPAKGEETPAAGTAIITGDPGYREVVVNEGSTEEDVERNTNSKKTLKGIALALLIAAILLATALLLKQCAKNKDNNKNNVPDTTEPSISTTTPDTEPTPDTSVIVDPVIPVINVNDEAALEEYAKYIQEELQKEGVEKSVDEIKNAIKLINVDYLEEKPFEYRETIYNATEDAGIIANTLGTGSIVVEDPANDQLITERALDDMIKNVVPGFDKTTLNLTKQENGYSIYELLDQINIVLNNKEEKYNTEYREQVAKLFNEVMARKVRTFTLTPNSTIGQYYLALGMYEAQHDNVKALTAGRLYGPMYGDEEQIDGSYGFICVEELQKYTQIGNTKNAFYTNYADLMLKDKTLTKSVN